MKFKYPLPIRIEKIINDAELKEISIGCSDSQVVKIKKDGRTFYLKIMKNGKLLQEYEKLKWLEGKIPVPKIIEFIQEYGNDYLITEEMPGKMLCDKYYINNPDNAMLVLKVAFQNIFSIDISDCPFNVSNEYKLSLIEDNINKGLVNDLSLSAETRKKFGTVQNLLEYLKNNRFQEEFVFSHGDTSLPNIFAFKDKLTGFIDVGESGIADKWFDLAICEKSILRNYGKEYIENFYDALNIKRDDFKINYYLLMMELYL